MSERTEEQTARLAARLVGKTILGAEVNGAGEIGSSYIVLQIEGDQTLYASSPALYVPVPVEES